MKSSTEWSEKVLCAPQPGKAGERLEQKILDRSAKVGVIGLGYVGLPLAIQMAEAGFQVIGIDVDREKVESVDAGISYIPDVSSEALLPLVTKERIRATQSLAARGRSPIFTKRTGLALSGDLGPQIVSDRVLGADERSLGRAVAPTE